MCVFRERTEFGEHNITGQKYKPVPRDDSYCLKMLFSMCRIHLYRVLSASKDIFLLMKSVASTFWRHQIDKIFFIFDWKFAGFF